MNTKELSKALSVNVETASLDLLHRMLSYANYKANGLSRLYEPLKDYIEKRTFNQTHQLVLMHYFTEEHGERLFIEESEEGCIHLCRFELDDYDPKGLVKFETRTFEVHGPNDRLLVTDDSYYVDQEGYAFYYDLHDSLFPPLGLRNCLGYIFQPPFHRMIFERTSSCLNYHTTRGVLAGLAHQEFLMLNQVEHLGEQNPEYAKKYESYSQEMSEGKNRIMSVLNTLDPAFTFSFSRITQNGRVQKGQEQIDIFEDGERFLSFVASYKSGKLYYEPPNEHRVKVYSIHECNELKQLIRETKKKKMKSFVNE